MIFIPNFPVYIFILVLLEKHSSYKENIVLHPSLSVGVRFVNVK